jgi:hypothetical protein
MSESEARIARLERWAAWIATGLSCLYYLWAYTVLTRHAAAFKAAFAGLGSDLPAPAQMLVDNQSWLYPALFGVAAFLVVAKEASLSNKRLSLVITLVVALVVIFIVDAIKTTLFLPLLDMFEKLA